VNAADVAERFIFVRERPGTQDNPYIQAWLEDAGLSIGSHDEVPWCGAFAKFIVGRCLGLPTPPLPARARSWLLMGVPTSNPQYGDVVVFKRGTGDQPGPNVLDAPGHVAFFLGWDSLSDYVRVVGGNQGNRVSAMSFPARNVLGFRRMA